MYFSSVKQPDIKVPACPSSEYEAFLSVVHYSVKQPKAIYLLGRLIALPDSSFEYGSLMKLSVMTAHFLLDIPVPKRLCTWMPAYTSCIDSMRLLKAIADP